MTLVEALKIFVPLVAAIFGLIAAYLRFIAKPTRDLSDKDLEKKLKKLLSSGENNHGKTKHYWWIKKKLRRIDSERLDIALRRIATSGEGSDGKEIWSLD